MENKFDTGDLYTNGENHWGKTLPGDFNVTTPENPLLSKPAFKPVQMHGNYVHVFLGSWEKKKKQYICFQQNKNKTNKNFVSLQINFCT